jgi:asparagine synthetase B (glutamine-hydrolysing)
MCGLSLILEGKGKIYVGDSVYSLRTRQRRESDQCDTSLNYMLSRRGPNSTGLISGSMYHVMFVLRASLLQFRGLKTIHCPLAYLDAEKSALAFNGEIYSGLPFAGEGVSDTMQLYTSLINSKTFEARLQVLSQLRGPWSLIFCDLKKNEIMIGRDCFGRRSLLFHLPDAVDPRFMVASTAPSVIPGQENLNWSELSCGVYHLRFSQSTECRESEVHMAVHNWNGRIYKCLNERKGTQSWRGSSERVRPICAFINSLDRSVETRVHAREYLTSQVLDYSSGSDAATVMILFSGGLDSTVLATLAHRHLPILDTIDLCNVCFHHGSSPDRLAARRAFGELRTVSPCRRWRFIEVNVGEVDVLKYLTHVKSLVHPKDTTMDFNIGFALWFATRARGRSTFYSPDGEIERFDYCSRAKIVLLGQGADELLGGYRRHRLAFETSGKEMLIKELNTDLERLWLRNMGRDDRVVSDLGREGRYPFLDEELVYEIRDMHTKHANAALLNGAEDKLLLRRSAFHLGLAVSSTRLKQAIQFGSRVSRLETILSK